MGVEDGESVEAKVGIYGFTTSHGRRNRRPMTSIHRLSEAESADGSSYRSGDINFWIETGDARRLLVGVQAINPPSPACEDRYRCGLQGQLEMRRLWVRNGGPQGKVFEVVRPPFERRHPGSTKKSIFSRFWSLIFSQNKGQRRS